MDQPSPFRAVLSIASSLFQVSKPNPAGVGRHDHSDLAIVLETLDGGGLEAVRHRRDGLESYLDKAASADPDNMDRDGALAFWINIYNAGAIRLAADALDLGVGSVLRVPGAFRSKSVTVAGEDLSLDSIEHAKIRRFKDPRIHAAIVCGSLSCPTLRYEPYEGAILDTQLDAQMRRFLTNGGAVETDTGIALNRVFLWYGADFVRAHRMPTFWPASKRSILDAVQEWLPVGLRGSRKVSFLPYDWALGCSVG